jgi:hypothetical protein
VPKLKLREGGYAEVFPLVRPISDRQVRVWNDVGSYLGVGTAGDSRSGGTIVINDFTHTSNDGDLNWTYVDTKEAVS